VSHWYFRRYVTSEEERAGRASPQLLREVAAMVRPYWAKMVALLAAAIVGIASNLAVPYITKQMIDVGVLRGDVAALTALSLTYLAALGASWAASYVRGYYTSWVANRVIYDLRVRMFKHLHRLDLDYFARNPPGKVMSRIINDTESLGEAVSVGVVDLVASVLTLGGALLIMVKLSLELSLVAFSIVPIMAVATLVIARRTRRAHLRTREKVAEVTSELEKSVAGAREMLTYIMRRRASIREFARVNLETLRASLEATKMTASISPVMNLIRAGGICAVLWYGGHLLVEGRVTVGTLVAFFGYLEMFFRPVMTLTMFYNTIQAALAALERIVGFLKEEPRVKERPDAVELRDVAGEVVFEDVWFGYDPSRPVIRGVSLRIRPGERVAIVGPTGAGKTTLVSLLLRFYDPQRGRVLIDGVDVRDVKIESLRRCVGYVPQEAVLFSGTVMDNIKFGRDVPDEEVVELCKLIGLHELIMQLPQGYQTPVREGGKNLSVGQRQLIAVARALLTNPKILVFDEAASSVDPVTEEKIRRTISTLLRGRTCIIIAHRLSMAAGADRIVVMDGGRVVEEGTHEELLKKGGLYAHLYEIQYGRAAVSP